MKGFVSTSYTFSPSIDTSTLINERCCLKSKQQLPLKQQSNHIISFSTFSEDFPIYQKKAKSSDNFLILLVVPFNLNLNQA